jgi:OOP family OmpA-OmpF porin
MKTKRIAQWAGLVAGAVFSVAAYSQAYVGASLGSTDAKDFCELRSSSCDKTDTAWRVFGGYYFTPNIALEAGFIDLGKVTDSDVVSNTKVEARAAELLGVFAYRANRAAIFGKAGGYYAQTKLSVETLGSVSETTESRGGLTFGLGAQYNFTRHLGVRGDWQRYVKVGSSSTGGQTDIDTFLLGLIWTSR